MSNTLKLYKIDIISNNMKWKPSYLLHLNDFNLFIQVQKLASLRYK